jgi:dihydrofolate reductase
MCPTVPERRSFDVVVAACRKTLGIGAEGGLPWHIPSDMRYFKQLTLSTRDPLRRNAVVMGRKTYESIPPKHRPLPDRLNVVLSRTPEADLRASNAALPPNVLVASSLERALAMLASGEHARDVENVFVIGGASVYAEALGSAWLERAYVTFVDLPDTTPLPPYDTHLPKASLQALIQVRAKRGAPAPSGETSIRVSASRRRPSSRANISCHASRWCENRTGWATWRWV